MPVFGNERLIHVYLTDEQIIEMENVRRKAYDAFREGKPGCVLAQVSFRRKRLSVTFCDYDESGKIARALGFEGDLGPRTF